MGQINEISSTKREEIKRISAFSLPDNPTASGFKPNDIKKTLYEPIVNENTSVIAEINRIVGELNSLLANMVSKEDVQQVVNGSELPVSAKAVADTVGNLVQSFDTKIENDITAGVDAANHYTDGNVISDISYTMDDDYKIYLKLTSYSGREIECEPIDLPLESVIVDATYRNKQLLLELNNGNVISVDIQDIISGLATTSDVQSLEGRVAELEQGGIGITVDDHLSLDSTKPVQNKVIAHQFIQITSDIYNHIGPYEQKVSDIETEIHNIKNPEAEPFPEPIGDMVNFSPNKIYESTSPIEELVAAFHNGVTHIRFTTSTTFDYSFINGYTGEDIKFINSEPQFDGGETWEINVLNGVAVAGKVIE